MIDIHAKNISLSDEQKELIQKKMEKLNSFARKMNDESAKIRVEIEYDDIKEKHQKIFCSVTIFVPQNTMRAETHAETVQSAIDICEEKLKVQIEKYKDKYQ